MHDFSSLAFSLMSCPYVIYESVRMHLLGISSRRPLVSANRFLTDKDVKSATDEESGITCEEVT